MKNKYCKVWQAMLLPLMLILNVVKAQEVDTTYMAKMKSIFQFLDKSKVPYGLLKDLAIEATELNYYRGTMLTDSNLVSQQYWDDIYLTLATAQIHQSATATLPNPNLVDSVWNAKRKTGQITLAGLYYKYSRFADDAQNKVTVVNEQIYDKYVDGVWQNPYATEQVMAFAPANNEYTGLNLNLVLPSELWLSNVKAQISKIQLDADDGLGFRNLTPNVLVQVHYADSGWKKLNFKVFFTNNTYAISHTAIHVKKYIYGVGPTAPLQFAEDVEITDPLENEETGLLANTIQEPDNFSPPGTNWILIEDYPMRQTFYITSTETFNGKNIKGYVTINYKTAGKQLKKPLIVAEGFDPGALSSPENYFGNQGIDDFLESITGIDQSDLKDILFFNPQYDIVYVDWKDGTADLRANALLLKTVIRAVNQVKVANGANPIEQNVLLGQSMGGVIARYALKKMELAGENHDTKLYISHDAPHQGANVPLSIQAMAIHMQKYGLKTYLGLFIASAVSGLNAKQLFLNFSPASFQLVSNRIGLNYQTDNTVFNQWQDELKNLGYPQNCRNIAISNGSQCGSGYPIIPADTLFYFSGQFKTRILGDLVGMIALPIIGIVLGEKKIGLGGMIPGSNKFKMHFETRTIADGGGNKIYDGWIKYQKKVLWLLPINSTLTSKTFYAPVGLNPLESLPGGYYPLGWFNESKSDTTALYINSYTHHQNSGFSFVPVVSALDIGQGNAVLTKNDYYQSYIGANPPPAPKNTPFDNFMTAFYGYDNVVLDIFVGRANNEKHITFNKHNGDWLAKELKFEAPLPLDDCSFFCNVSSNNIQGPASICGTVSYSVANLPAGTTVKWFATGAVQIQGANNLTTVAVKSINNGQGYLTAMLSNGICGQKSVVKIISSSGLPGGIDMTGAYFNNGGFENPFIVNNADVYPINGIQFSVPQLQGVTYKWTVNGSTYGSLTTNSVIVYTPDCGGGFPSWTIFNPKVTITNACGSTTVCEEFKFYCMPTKHLDPLGPCYEGPAIELYNDTDNNFVVYPNPAGNQIKITYQNMQSDEAVLQALDYTVELFNANGVLQTVLQSESAQGDVLINTSSLPNGIYYLHIQQGNQLIKKQVIIQH